MKQLPNLFTLLNLFFGCCAIVLTLTAYPFIDVKYGVIQGMSDMQMASYCILLAALMDVLDGAAARLLHAESAIGKDLDSLADVVSFGVAPGVILYQFLWYTYMIEENALHTPFLAMAPAFIIPCAAALRLAKFNNSSDMQKNVFIGIPTPAIGIFLGVMPLVYYNAYDIVGRLIENRWFLYGLIIVAAYLMNSTFTFLKWHNGQRNIASLWPQLTILIVSLIAAIFLNYAAIWVGFVLYILLSFVYKPAAQPILDPK